MSKNGGRIHDIKETASDAVSIIRELRTPEAQATLDKVQNLTDTAKEIMEKLKTPEWVENINNFRAISQNLDNTSARMENMTRELKNMEIVSETTGLVKAIKNNMGPGDGKKEGEAGNDLRELVVAVKEMLQSIKGLTDELKITLTESGKSAIIQDVRQTASDISETLQTIRNQ